MQRLLKFEKVEETNRQDAALGTFWGQRMVNSVPSRHAWIEASPEAMPRAAETSEGFLDQSRFESQLRSL